MWCTNKQKKNPLILLGIVHNTSRGPDENCRGGGGGGVVNFHFFYREEGYHPNFFTIVIVEFQQEDIFGLLEFLENAVFNFPVHNIYIINHMQLYCEMLFLCIFVSTHKFAKIKTSQKFLLAEREPGSWALEEG